MSIKEIGSEELSMIVGGSLYDMEMFLGFFSAIVILVAVFKLYNSSQGKVGIGNDYSFEWKWLK